VAVKQTLNVLNQITKRGSHLYSLKCDTGSVTDTAGLFNLLHLGTSRLDALGTSRLIGSKFLIKVLRSRVTSTVS
jgi:hypothetical protein